MSQAPLRDVVRVLELDGERGGKLLVHVTTCGCYHIQRRAQKRIRCVACWVRAQLEAVER